MKASLCRSIRARRERRGRRCCRVPNERITRTETYKLPRSWQPLSAHPDLKPGPWVPCSGWSGVVSCRTCGALWYLLLDPARTHYTDMIEMAPELAAIVSENARLADVLAIVPTADRMLQLMLRDWFALGELDEQPALEALVSLLAQPSLTGARVLAILDFVAAVLTRPSREQAIRLDDPSPLVELLARHDLWALDPQRAAAESIEIRRQLQAIVRSAFGTSVGATSDRVAVDEASREKLLALFARNPEASPEFRVALRAVGAVDPQLQRVEHLVEELEEILDDGAKRVTALEIAPVIEVVRSFWAWGTSSAVADSPCWDPGLRLYSRCRDLLFALRHANLVPEESRTSVAAALIVVV